MDAQTDALHETQAAAVKELGHEEMKALHLAQDTDNFGLSHNDRRPWVPFGTGRFKGFINRDVKDFFVQENNCIKGLTLGGRSDILLNSQMGEKVFNFFFSHIAGVGFGFMVSDIPYNPVAIGLFCAVSVVVVPHYLTHLIHKPELWIWAEFF
jgi:hypothetical protein